jgi:hypothetical protein
LIDHDALKKEQHSYKELPVVKKITSQIVIENYFKIKQEVTELIEGEIEVLLNTPGQ